MNSKSVPLLALTLGDVAGVGPEVVVRALDQLFGTATANNAPTPPFRPLVIGDLSIVRRAAALLGSPLSFKAVNSPTALCDATVPVWNPVPTDFRRLVTGVNQVPCGEAAYQWLLAATDAALAGQIDGIVTAPISKTALHMAGHHYPGHTEILAKRCGVHEFAMMLHLPQGGAVKGRRGISVAHVTLHTSIASVPGLLNQRAIQDTIHLLHAFIQRLGQDQPRIGVCALNPHAGEAGLFGREEAAIIQPAVEQVVAQGIHASGPIPADTLLLRAINGEFDGVAAMYHDQGHIALKLIGFRRAVNITLGLPIVRTSPSHGTGFDIAWQGNAEADGMIEAIRIAHELCRTQP